MSSSKEMPLALDNQYFINNFIELSQPENVPHIDEVRRRGDNIDIGMATPEDLMVVKQYICCKFAAGRSEELLNRRERKNLESRLKRADRWFNKRNRPNMRRIKVPDPNVAGLIGPF